MRTITGLLQLVSLLLLHASDSNCKNNDSFKGSNVCTRIERVEKSHVIPKTRKVKEAYQTWCFAIPPLCTEYRWKVVRMNKTVVVNHTATVYDCCKGYEKKDNSCVPVCRLGCLHGECIEPDTCLCEEGWREPYCTIECEPNRYGRGCKNNCTCLNGGTCDRRDGSCYCTEGYIGNFCELPCPNDMYGMNCSEKCKCQNGAMCDIKDGTCDCEPGYYGEYCERPCQPGSHGAHCMNECVCLPETTDSCNPVDGECICKPGYKGMFCEEECSNFTYGIDCQYKCICIHGEFCDPVVGKCFCNRGWTGATCAETCPSGTYGEECKLKCPKCPNVTVTCNHVTGYCDCPPGSFGDVCEKACSEGYWGSNCSKQCECLRNENEMCNGMTGECICSPGWRELNCSEPCYSGWYGYNCSSQCNCSDGNTCNATTGSCFNLLQEKHKTAGDFDILGLYGGIFCGILIIAFVAYVIWRFDEKAISAFRMLFSKRNVDCSNTGTSTDNIINAHFSNPVYGCSDDAQHTDSVTEGNDAIVGNSPPPARDFQDLKLRIDDPCTKDSDQRSFRHSYKTGLLKVDKSILNKPTVLPIYVSTGSGLKRISNINDLTVGCFARRNSKRLSGKNPESPDTENAYVPEALDDFKIPEDDTYENAVSARRKLEMGDKEVPHKE